MTNYSPDSRVSCKAEDCIESFVNAVMLKVFLLSPSFVTPKRSSYQCLVESFSHYLLKHMYLLIDHECMHETAQNSLMNS